MKNNKNAFTLVELSIVLIIIGLVVAGVVSGKSLVEVAKVFQANSLTNTSPVHVIEDLNMWFDSSSGESFSEDEKINGANVTDWKNINKQLSTKQDGVPVGSGPTYNQNGINSLPSITFEVGVDTRVIVNTPLDWSEDFTVFAVASSDNFLDGQAHGLVSNRHGAGSGQWWSFGAGLVATTVRLEVAPGVSSSVNIDVRDAGPLIYVVSKNSTLIEGTVLSTTSFTGATASRNITGVDIGGITNNFMIGSWSGALQCWDGDVSEVIVFSRELPDSEKTLIQNYLAQKWGIDLL